MHIMIDIETMGTRPNAPILSIGACRFTPEAIEDTFYRRINLQSSVDAGGIIDADTLLWWLKQSDAARLEITQPDTTLRSALEDFATWVTRDQDLQGVWGNGASFDNVLLTEAYKRLGMSAPWPFRLDRCYRTIKNQLPAPYVQEGEAHNALDDAVAQTKHLIHIWEAQRELQEG